MPKKTELEPWKNPSKSKGFDNVREYIAWQQRLQKAKSSLIESRKRRIYYTNELKKWKKQEQEDRVELEALIP